MDGQADLTVTLWTAASGGTQLYQETQSVQVSPGSFSLYLGAERVAGPGPLNLPGPRDALRGGGRGTGGSALPPLYQLATTPYAGFAQYAGTAGTAGAVDWSSITNVPQGALSRAVPSAGSRARAAQVAKWNGSAGANLTLTGTTFVPPGTAYAFHVYMTDTQTNVPNDAFFGCQVDYSTTRLRP